MLYVVFFPFSVLLELSFSKLVSQETLGILNNNYASFISTLDYSRKWKIIFCALYVPHFCIFQETYVMPFSHLLLLTTIVFGKGGISFLHFFTMKNIKKRRKKKSSPIKLITANDLSLCQVFLILHKLKFVNFLFFKFFYALF